VPNGLGVTRQVPSGEPPGFGGDPVARSRVGALRLLLLAAIVLPLPLAAIAGYLSYRHDYDQAVTSSSDAAAVAAENTAKVLDKYLVVAARIEDLLGTRNTTQIRASEQVFHDWMKRQLAGMREVAAAWVIDETGRELVSARVYPVNPDRDQSGRDDYRALRDTGARTFIWLLRARSLEGGDFEPYFTVSVRRMLPDGRFGGVVVVAVSGRYLASFYNSLFDPQDDKAYLLKGDGTVLVQYPAPAPSSEPQLPDPLFAKAISDGAETGIADRGTPLDGAGRIVAVKRVADYPAYVAIERSKASILRECLRPIAGSAVFGSLAVAALIVLARAALRRARRERSALARAGEASAERATLEVALHRARRLEAVGWLAAGIAHDFDRLVMNVQGNVERLEAAIRGTDLGQQKLVAAIKSSCAQASAATKRLLGLVQREPINPRPININEVVISTLERAQQFGDRLVDDVRLQKDLWRTCVDSDQLATVLLNLVFNARDAFAGHGDLIIETANVTLDASSAGAFEEALPGDYVGLLVERTGHETKPETGEQFADLDDGAWLGLSLMRQLVQSSRGHWTIDGTLGESTTISLYFPRHIADRDSDKRSPIKSNAGDSRQEFSGAGMER
jgi:two-component system, NtrC family, sensor kinase